MVDIIGEGMPTNDEPVYEVNIKVWHDRERGERIFIGVGPEPTKLNPESVVTTLYRALKFYERQLQAMQTYKVNKELQQQEMMIQSALNEANRGQRH